MKKMMAFFLATVMCAASLTACGKDGESGNSGSTAQGGKESTQEGSKDAGTESSAADKGEGGLLTVGTNAEFPPFEYIGDNGEPDGFDIALIKAIGEKMGMEVKVENMEFDALVASIGTKIDMAVAGMTIVEEKKKVVDFSDPYYTAIQYVIVPEGSDIKDIEGLKGKNIGVQLGTTGDYKVDEIEGATASRYNKAVDAVNDLINGRLDAVIIDKNPALVFQEKFAGKVKAIDGNDFGFELEEYAIALPKGSEFVEKVNQALADLKADGTFDALVKEYIEEQ